MSKKAACIFGATVAALLILSIFFDLPISMAVFNIDSKFGMIFAVFGAQPSTLIGAFSAAALLVTRKKQVFINNITGLIVYGAIGVFSAVMFNIGPLNYLLPDMPIDVSIVIALILFAGCILVSNRIAKKNTHGLRHAAVVGVFLLIISIVPVNIIKQLWGRPRMYIMTDPASEFIPWYLPQGPADSDGYRSFPSGHSANAAAIIWITMLPMFIKRLKNKETLLYIISAIWTVTVMMSRVIIGEHFVSDTVAGAAISIAAFFIVKGLTSRYYNKKTLAQ